MTSLVEPIGESYTTTSKDANHNICRGQCRNKLKSKNNTYKLKCKRILKRKLKKYRLRQDGKEDQDIIDVSDKLVSSLFIRSPTKTIDNIELELQTLRPRNYLYKMVRRKSTTLNNKKESQTSDVELKTLIEDEVEEVSPNTEEKKQTNAFKLLMESRNKSLGSNSPGKEKPIDEIEIQEILDKKNTKVKRQLLLQKMAETKGSLLKKEMEQYQEKYINKKLKRRAEKLKSMIMNQEPKQPTVKGDKSNSLPKVRSPLDIIDTEKNKQAFDKPVKSLQLVSIFDQSIDSNISPEKKHIPEEDKEFLNKLSPSIRKKESMLSYFKKVDKDSDNVLIDTENENGVIKVKLSSRPKKRHKRKKLSLERASENSHNLEKYEITDLAHKPKTLEYDKTISGNHSKDLRKRKRESKDEKDCNADLATNSTDDARPKRNVKKPIKYNDDIYLTSSDDELVIFTPKKSKHSECKNNSAIITTIVEEPKSVKISLLNKTEEILNKRKKSHKDIYPKKPVKLAPIFAKSQLDPAAIEAKQKFLQSGVPDKLKKLTSKQKDSNNQGNNFLKVVHIQQLNMNLPILPSLYIDEKEFNIEHTILSKSQDTLFSKLINLSISQYSNNLPFKNNQNIQSILRTLKQFHPKFPVYRTYKLLRDKKKGEFRDSNIFSFMDSSVEILNYSMDIQNDNPDQLTWCNKYKPMSGKEIIGNFDSIKELRKWLVTWTENDKKSKALNTNDSDSSDFYQSDPDSRDSMKSNNNLLILSGPVGSGKTSSVYAVAAELSMKVIEVNASGKRTGKIMLQDLQEATQSHKVNRHTGSSENCQNLHEIIETIPVITEKKRGRPKKVDQQIPKKFITKVKTESTNGLTVSQESTRTAMSLILIDDADIVFDQDDGFCSAIVQLVQSSKRPVILITRSLTCPHLLRFMHGTKILKMRSLLPNMLGIWLDLMCLADSGTCWPGLGAKLLNFFKGDMRKTINYLQFYMCSQALNIEGNSQVVSQSNEINDNTEDENSSMSWVDCDSIEDKNKNAYHIFSSQFWSNYVKENLYANNLRCPFGIFDIWWNVPKIFDTSNNAEKPTGLAENLNKSKTSLELMCDVIDSIAICDYFSHIKPEAEANMTSHPWYYSACDSVSELDSLDNYDRKYEVNSEICCELLKGTIYRAQGKLGFEGQYNLDAPGMAAKRQRDRIVSQHNKLTTYFSPQSSLDRKALALDYWSSCRTICRIERSKTDSNSKRNNRFCHYLKSFSVSCKTDLFDSLANSLNPNGNQ